MQNKSVGVSSTRLDQTNLEANTVYKFKVAATNAIGRSGTVGVGYYGTEDYGTVVSLLSAHNKVFALTKDRRNKMIININNIILSF